MPSFCGKFFFIPLNKMKFLVLSLLAGACALSLVTGTSEVAGFGNVTLYSFRSPDDFKVVNVNGLREVETKYLLLLTSNEPVVFYLAKSRTYLTRKEEEFWDVIEDLDLLFEEAKAKPAAKKIELIEFRFDKLYHADHEDLIPVSPCHSEVQGHGGAIAMQLNVGLSSAYSGALGISPNIYVWAISLTAKVTVDRSGSIATTITCSAKEGEMVQVFLARTHFLYYTPYFRLRQFDIEKGKFEKAGKMVTLPQKRVVTSGGVGEWVCGTSSVIPLQCSHVVYDLGEEEL